MRTKKIFSWVIFSILALFAILSFPFSNVRAAICFFVAAFFACPFLHIIEKLDKYIEQKYRKRAGIATVCIFSVCGLLTTMSHYYYTKHPPVCKFSSFDNSPVTINYYNKTGDFQLYESESQIDVNNLEFISEDPEIATIYFDHVVLDDHIYYQIKPVSRGETNVYIRCSACGGESKKIHVTVDLPEKPTETTTTTTSIAKATRKNTKSTTTTTETTTTVTTTVEITTYTEPITAAEEFQQQDPNYNAVGEQSISEKTVILNNDTMCYHLSGSCRAAKKISTENYEEVVVNDVGEVESWGYWPCGICAGG